jgi:hypothetical protein
MAAEQAALKRRIAEKRMEIVEDIDRIRDELRYDYKTATNPNILIARQPFLSAGVALGLGLFAGLQLANALGVPKPPVVRRPEVELPPLVARLFAWWAATRRSAAR